MRIYFLGVLLLWSTAFIAQDCEHTLSGTVIDLHDNSKLSGALIIVVGPEITVVSDAEGNYTLPNLCNATYTLQVSHPFCTTMSFTIKVNEDTQKNLRLEHHLEELNQVTLSGKSYAQKTQTHFENSISKETLEKHNHAALGDVLKNISGVSSLDTGNAIVKPLINGLHSSRIVLINNGVRMEDQEWGIEHAPNLDINAAGNITVVKGAAALQYGGDAIGGLIVSESPKVPVKDTLYGKTLFTANTNGRGTSLSSQLVQGTSKGWYGIVQGTLKKSGDYETPDYILSNTGTFERDLSIHFGLNRFNHGLEAHYSLVKNDIGILRAAHLGGAEDQLAAINRLEPQIIEDFTYTLSNPRQSISHHLARISAFKKIENLGKLSLQYDAQLNYRKEFDIRRGDANNLAALDLELTTHRLSMDLDANPTDILQLKTGILGSYQDNFADPSTKVRRLIPDYERQSFGLYGLVNYRLASRCLVEFGGRFDYTTLSALKYYRSSFWEARNYDLLYSELILSEENGQVLANPKLDFGNTSATLGIQYTLGEHYKLYANYARASRAPNPSELFSEGLHHSAARIEYGDFRFESENSDKFAVTLQKTGNKFEFSVSPFINTISNFLIIEPIDVENTIRGHFQVWEYRQTPAQLLGIDIDASLALTPHLTFNHQFALTKGYDLDQNTPLINMPPVNLKNKLVYALPDFHGLELALQSEYVFRQNEYPDRNFEIFIPQTDRFELLDISTPPAAYHLLNFNSNITLKQSKQTKLTLGLSISNVLNTSYRNYLNLLRFYADDVGRNFLLHLKINY